MSTPSFRQREVIPPRSPVVLSVPHAGTATTGFAAELAPGLDVRGDADLFVDRLYGVSSDQAGGAPDEASHHRSWIAACLSRFVCDMNRDPDDVSPTAVPAHPAPQNGDGRGFVWAVTTTGEAALARPLTLEEWRARAAIHTAYHAAIARALARAHDRFGFAVLVDGHSMPSVGRHGHRDTGQPRAEIVPGDRDGTSCSPGLSLAVKSYFENMGYEVSFNNPYKGGFITRHHGRPSEGIHAIQIEARRDLYMDEATFTERQPAFTRLQAALRGLLVALDDWRPD